MIDWEITDNRCGLAELKDGVRTGVEYTYYSSDRHWYCTKHRSWRYRQLKQPARFSVELRKAAIAKGMPEDLFHSKIEVVEVKTKKRKSKKSGFISLF
tara:strand:+ start:269 stop:562 length:294 start_codon:yes stop_codon:yes gene_type:complete